MSVELFFKGLSNKCGWGVTAGKGRKSVSFASKVEILTFDVDDERAHIADGESVSPCPSDRWYDALDPKVVSSIETRTEEYQNGVCPHTCLEVTCSDFIGKDDGVSMQSRDDHVLHLVAHKWSVDQIFEGLNFFQGIETCYGGQQASSDNAGDGNSLLQIGQAVRDISQTSGVGLSLDDVAILRSSAQHGQVAVRRWTIDQRGFSDAHSDILMLRLGEENEWYRNLVDDLNNSQEAGYRVVIVSPSPSDDDLCFESSGLCHISRRVLHVIACCCNVAGTPVLLDLYRDGNFVDRRPWNVNAMQVSHIFQRVGWYDFCHNPDFICIMNDGRIRLSPNDPIHIFDGYYGTVHVSMLVGSGSGEESLAYMSTPSGSASDGLNPVAHVDSEDKLTMMLQESLHQIDRLEDQLMEKIHGCHSIGAIAIPYFERPTAQNAEDDRESDDSEEDSHVPHTWSGDLEEAPCPSDRWCAESGASISMVGMIDVLVLQHGMGACSISQSSREMILRRGHIMRTWPHRFRSGMAFRQVFSPCPCTHFSCIELLIDLTRPKGTVDIVAVLAIQKGSEIHVRQWHVVRVLSFVQPVDVLAEVPNLPEDLGVPSVVTFQGNECRIAEDLQMNDADVCVFLWNQEEATHIVSNFVDPCSPPNEDDLEDTTCWSLLIQDAIGEFDWVSIVCSSDTRIDHHLGDFVDPTLGPTLAIGVPWLQGKIGDHHSVRLVVKDSSAGQMVHTAFVLHLPDGSAVCEHRQFNSGSMVAQCTRIDGHFRYAAYRVDGRWTDGGQTLEKISHGACVECILPKVSPHEVDDVAMDQSHSIGTREEFLAWIDMVAAPLSVQRVEQEDSMHDSHQVQVCLEWTVPTSFPQMVHTNDTQGMLPWLSNLFIPWATQCWPLPDGLQVHESTAHALEHADNNLLAQHTQTFLYVDGSATDKGCGWAVAVIDAGYNWCGAMVANLRGVIFDQVSLDSNCDEWWGAKHGDNIDAELSGCLVAIMWFLANCEPNQEVTLCPDLCYSLELLQGTCAPNGDRPLSQMLAEFGPLAVQRGLKSVHVRAHHGWEWNELVDRLAVFAVDPKNCKPRIDIPVLHDLAMRPEDISLLSMHPSFLPQTMLSTMPFHTDEPMTHKVASSQGIHLDTVNRVGTVQEHWIDFQALSYNVLSIRDRDGAAMQEVGRKAESKTDRLDAQFHQEGFHVVCLQETRTDPGCHSSTNYAIFSSGAEKRGKSLHFGCEIWIHKSKAWSVGQSDGRASPDTRTIQVVHSSSRCLVLQLKVAGQSWTVISAHAPSVGTAHTSEDVQSWWKDFSCKFKKWSQGSFVVVGIDANAALGTHTSDAVGDHGAEAGNFTGDLFSAMIEENRLFVPSTHAALHRGQTWTWRHPKGRVKRCDYLLLDDACAELCSSSWVIDNFDGGFSHEDHLPVAIHLQGSFRGSSQRRYRLDEDLMHDPERCEAFRRAVSTLPIPTWNTPIEKHAHLFRHQIKQLALQFFSSSKKKAKNKWMSEPTANLIFFKRQVLQFFRGLDSGIEKDEIKEQLRQIEKQVTSMCRCDKQKYFDDVAMNLAKEGEAGCFKSVFRHLARLGASKQKRKGQRLKPLPALKTVDGEVVRSFEHRQAVFFEQFATTEGAQMIGLDEFVQTRSEASESKASATCSQVIPSLAQILTKLKRLKRGKATGPDEIPSALLKVGGIDLARHLQILFAKASMLQHEPLQWKSGMLVPLFKKGSSQAPDNYRSIFLSDHTAKSYHSCFRDVLVDALEVKADNWQFGGRKARGTDMAHHMVQAFGAWCQHQGKSHATFFLDLHSAFYQVLRQVLYKNHWTDEQLCWLMHNVGISPEIVHSYVRQHTATEHLKGHDNAVLADMFDGAHFQMAGVNQIAVPSRGTRPGDPIGDVCFNLVMIDMIKSVRASLQAQNLQWLGGQNGTPWQVNRLTIKQPAFLDIAFVDDVCILLTAEGEDLQRLAAQVTSLWCHEAASRGLKVNFSKDKTELMLNYRGAGSRKLRQETWIHQGGFIPILDEEGHHELKLVRGYKHLGTYIQEDCRPNRDIVHKKALARQAWGPLLRPFFQRREISAKTKADIFSSLIMSRYTFQVHTWSWVRPSTLDSWCNGIRPLLFPLVKGRTRGCSVEILDTETLCGLANMMTPRDMMAKQRLQYTKRALAHGPAFLWALVISVEDQDGWGHWFGEDLKWLLKFSQVKLPEVDTIDIRAWLQFIASSDEWARWVKQAGKACASYRARQSQVKVWELHIADTLQKHEVNCCPRVVVPGSVECTLCGQTFKSKRALAMHSHATHGYLPEVKFFALGSMCFSCGKEYHHRPRLICHLHANHRCLDQLRGCFPPIPNEIVKEYDTR